MNSISFCGKSDVGMKRQRNEDSFAIEADYGFFIVADGMGGHAGGDVASLIAAETARDFLKEALSGSEIRWPFGVDHSLPRNINILSSGIRLANMRIFNESTGIRRGMGTTMAVLLLQEQKAYVCHVGDSRIYRIRNNYIEQLTEDHSLVADEIRRGAITRDEARSFALRNILTRAVGTSEDVECDCRIEDLKNGDIFLLCSDGLTEMLEDSEILAIVNGSGEAERSCEDLIRKANEKGGDDNVTAIVVEFT